MHKKRGEVNGKHVCEDENVMRQEASEKGFATVQIIKNHMRREASE
jgi:hypothetical protein